ncbi:MAG: cob(I)yrinic acid a,c-diamide adenosyltransferase [Bacteroidia bacterium]|jgi:cob(I)alamin adenosyltransferase|nr:cob(I)yrinic acid a,c-diamide adenosyltransferase [Bacteroidia bacterium]
MTFKIYTKTGDAGQTSLIGGVRVPKYHLRIESYGTVDELNSYIGVIKDSIQDEHVHQLLYEIQDRLFTIGSVLASDPEKSKMKVPDLHEADVLLLENEMDMMDASLPPLKNFVLPGGLLASSFCHVARCVCRRAERLAVELQSETEVPAIITTYLNRLSDYLFMLSRKLVHDAGTAEVTWRPRM